MASPTPNAKKGTNLFMRQGHTSGPFGNDPFVEAHGEAGDKPKDLKP